MINISLFIFFTEAPQGISIYYQYLFILILSTIYILCRPILKYKNIVPLTVAKSLPACEWHLSYAMYFVLWLIKLLDLRYRFRSKICNFVTI